MTTPIALASIHRCFEGDIPNILATSSADGSPNVIYLSQVLLLDDDHVAISNQFLRKTLTNLADNPIATLLLLDPGDWRTYKLLVRHLGNECEGERFDDARLELESLAALVGMDDVFALKGLEIFRVLDAVDVPFGNSGG